MKRSLFVFLFLFSCLFLLSCQNEGYTIKGNPIVRYRARPGSLFNYRYLQLLENTRIGNQNRRDDEPASIKASSSSVRTIKLIDYKKFMDDSGFITTIKETPRKIAVLDSSLAKIWILSGGTFDFAVQDTIAKGIRDKDEVTLVDQTNTNVIDYEILLANDLDLIILNSNNEEHRKVAELLRMYDIPVLAFQIDNFLDYLSTLSIFTKILETPEKYEEYGSKLFDQVELILEKTNLQKERKKVFILPKENQDHSAELVRSILLELNAQPTILDNANSSQNENVNLTQTPITIDLRWKEHAKLQNYLLDQRWDLAYDYLAEIIYGDEVQE